MLTPDRLKSKTFQTTATGSYRSEDVDNFMEEVTVSYEQLFRENGALIKKLSLLANKVEEYKKDEDSLRHALFAAQKLADQIVSEAKENAEAELSNAKESSAVVVADANKEAEKVINDAKETAAKLINEAKYLADTKIHEASVKADELLGGINRKATQEKLIYDMLQTEVSDFRAKLMGLYEEHLKLLDKIPAIVKESQEKVDTEVVADEAVEIEETPAEPVIEEVPAVEETEETFELSELEDDGVEVEEETAENEAEEAFSLDEEFEIDDIDEIEEETAGEKEEEIENIDSFTLTDIDDEEEEETETVDDSLKTSANDGFSLDFSDLDLEEEIDDIETEEDEEETDDITMKYASLDEEFDDEDDDDDGAISFKKFFRKK